jgi:hypothetical protein
MSKVVIQGAESKFASGYGNRGLEIDGQDEQREDVVTSFRVSAIYLCH